VMVVKALRSRGIDTHMIEVVKKECHEAGCEWLHVDFAGGLGKFYFQSCDFTQTAAGIFRLR
jgi:hypothetical protein